MKLAEALISRGQKKFALELQQRLLEEMSDGARCVAGPMNLPSGVLSFAVYHLTSKLFTVHIDSNYVGWLIYGNANQTMLTTLSKPNAVDNAMRVIKATLSQFFK